MLSSSDVTLGEDACRVRAENAPHVFAAVRNAALNPLRGAGHERIASAARYVAARAIEALALLGFTPPPNEKTLGDSRGAPMTISSAAARRR